VPDRPNGRTGEVVNIEAAAPIVGDRHSECGTGFQVVGHTQVTAPAPSLLVRVFASYVGLVLIARP
jgi:hypothetical protein